VANFLDILKVMYKGKAVIVEGGAIDSNGRGTLLTSEECLMHPDIQVRNQILPKQITKLFKEYLGITNVICWVMVLKAMTRTDIDDLCRFINEDTIVTIIETNTETATIFHCRTT
jgi:agmatine deiminase